MLFFNFPPNTCEFDNINNKNFLFTREKRTLCCTLSQLLVTENIYFKDRSFFDYRRIYESNI